MQPQPQHTYGTVSRKKSGGSNGKAALPVRSEAAGLRDFKQGRGKIKKKKKDHSRSGFFSAKKKNYRWRLGMRGWGRYTGRKVGEWRAQFL